MNTRLAWRGAGWALAACLGACACAHAAGPAAAASIPYQAEGPAAGALLSRVALALLVCGAAGWGVLLLLRRGGFAPGALRDPARRLEVLEIRRTGPKAALMVVRYEDEQLLLAQGEQQTVLLHRRPLSGGAPAQDGGP
ncbi:MAG: hypothetical protein EPO01_20985 [Aquabacterium sp.]|nr:MAG: hypothetical protein EPO01_20985 [Aquabacterium sp.]